MRTYTRIVFGLNALYQLAVGCVFLFAPVTGIGLYGFPESDTHVVAARVALRALGTFVLLAGGISAVIAGNPDKNPVLLTVMGATAILTLVGWAVTLGAQEVTASQVALDIVVQALLLIAVVGYRKRAGQSVTAAVR